MPVANKICDSAGYVWEMEWEVNGIMWGWEPILSMFEYLQDKLWVITKLHKNVYEIVKCFKNKW